MNDTQALEQKLEELIAQLNNLLAQLGGEKPAEPIDLEAEQHKIGGRLEKAIEAELDRRPNDTRENLERELQRLKARRQSTISTDPITEGAKAKDKNG
jgi:hypothetical protein